MKKAMKVLGILLCAVLLVVGSVAATLAYLTSKTERVVNTFTVGNVAITLTEAKINGNGQPVNNAGNVVTELKDAERLSGKFNLEAEKYETTNTYHFMPQNESYTKDPTVTVLAGSDVSYVRLMVEIEGMTWNDFVDSIDFNSTSWTCVNANAALDNNGKAVYELRYNDKVAATTGNSVLEAPFTKIERDDDGTYNSLSKLKNIVIEAHAIQADSFEDDPEGTEKRKTAVQKAWEAFNVADMLRATVVA